MLEKGEQKKKKEEKETELRINISEEVGDERETGEITEYKPP